MRSSPLSLVASLVARSLVARSLVAGGLAAVVATGLLASSATADPVGGAAPTGKGRILPTDDAVLQTPATEVTKTLAPDAGCQTLLDTGDGDCAVVRGADGDLVFTVEPTGEADPVLIERPWIVRVYTESDSVENGWRLVLENPEPDVRTFANVAAKVEDVTGDGSDEIVFGYRAAGTGGFLEFDVVLPDAAEGAVVAAHDRLAKGTVVVKPGRIVDYSAVYEEEDGTCCPSFIAKSTIKYERGAFRVVRVKNIPTKQADVPPGDLG